ncbi:hypothetical protein NQ317_005194 [Molorchus minor]|uniref:Uncharacterized protein n=1 Tax=Molorchus minor TaxID=1323400 RepID=A0ABQ9J0Y2_9CUCU|nr:hypothetical protein NQ317_005194 [Molorchus minor]
MSYIFILFVAMIVMFVIYVYAQWKIKRQERYLGYECAVKSGGSLENSHQQDDIYNISSRVQGHDPWPTHDAHLSIDHITRANQLNKPNYDDAPPSYEEAMRIAASNSREGTIVAAIPPQTVVVVPKATD